MNNSILTEEFITSILSSSGTIITPHLGADGDAIGSCLALSLILKAKGIPSVILTKDIQSIEREKEKLSSVIKILLPSPLYKEPKNVFPPIIEKIDKNVLNNLGNSLTHIYVDCSICSRIGEAFDELYSNCFIKEKVTTLAIDHHQNEAECTLSFIDKNSPSTGNLMYKLAKKVLGDFDDKHLAIALFYAIASDTDSFRHLNEKDSETFEIASDLVKKGANPSIIYSEMHSGKTLDSLKYLAKILNNIQSYKNGKVLIALDDKECFKTYTKFYRPSNSVYDMLLSVKDAGLVAFLKYKETPNEIEGSLRVSPNSHYDASLISKDIAGGGGHKKAAGFTFIGNIEETLKKLLEVIDKNTI